MTQTDPTVPQQPHTEHVVRESRPRQPLSRGVKLALAIISGVVIALLFFAVGFGSGFAVGHGSAHKQHSGQGFHQRHDGRFGPGQRMQGQNGQGGFGQGGFGQGQPGKVAPQPNQQGAQGQQGSGVAPQAPNATEAPGAPAPSASSALPQQG